MAVNIGLPSDDGVPNQGWKLYLTSLIMVTVAGLFVIARCIIRFPSRSFGSDDYSIAASLVRTTRSKEPSIHTDRIPIGILNRPLNRHPVGYCERLWKTQA
jgi:hypothetical protein